MSPEESFIAKALLLIESRTADTHFEIELTEALGQALLLLQGPNKKELAPTKEIMELYHRILPMLPKVIRLNDRRLRHLVTRWNESEDQQSLAFWESYFRSVAASDFLTGKSSHWVANFDWLVNPTNILKVREGNYRNREDKSGTSAAASQLFDSVKLEQQRRLGARSQ